MSIDILSNTRGILSFYDGSQYVIYSQFYGVIAYSTSIKRIEGSKNKMDQVTIDFTMCDWTSYWDLKSIITRGIKKLEKQYVNKIVNINYNKLNDGNMYISNKFLSVKLEDR